jgi:hypothetical protein
VTADIVLQRLAALRRRSEQRALEALVVQADLCRRTEQQLEEAARSTARHLREARTRERQLIGSLTGRTVSLATVIRVQMEIDRATLETARLRAAQARTQVALLTQQGARAEASANFRRRQRAVIKIDLAHKQEIARKSRWDAACDEAEDEDRNVAIMAGLRR